MPNYIYKETTVTTKKLAGVYDSDKNTIDVDGEDKSILDELKDFTGACVEITIKLKEETDLTENE